LEKLQTLRLIGMYDALTEQMNMPEIQTIGFEERLGLLADREMTERQDRRLKASLRQAKLEHHACVEDLDYRAPRGLDKALILQLSACRWVHDGLNLIINAD
jgi:DNA replication protein DnaC